MEQRPIPKPKKKNDKGIASRLRELHGTFSVYFEGVSRRTIYTTARRLGFVAITRTEGDGLRVWRGDPVTGGKFMNLPANIDTLPTGEDLQDDEIVVDTDYDFGSR